MPKWVPEPVWEGQDAYVVGGGPSLASFRWDLLAGERVVGCNSAMLDTRSAPFVSIGIFGDHPWWLRFRGRLATFGGLVAACTPELENAKNPTWLLALERSQRPGLSEVPGRLANGNTGILGANLALQLGARRVFLLGFDLRAGARGEPNFHEIRHETANTGVYPKFIGEWLWVSHDLKRAFPGREVVNVTDGSDLEGFPVVSIEEHFAVKGSAA